MLIIPVDDDEVLYRRVPCVEGLYIIQAGGIIKVSSAAFSDRSFRPPVNRAELCHHDPGETQRDPSDGVVSVVTGDVRSIIQPEEMSFTHNLFVFICLKQPQGANNLWLLLFCLFLDVAEAVIVA